jgi:hypothetical protein
MSRISTSSKVWSKTIIEISFAETNESGDCWRVYTCSCHFNRMCYEELVHHYPTFLKHLVSQIMSELKSGHSSLALTGLRNRSCFYRTSLIVITNNCGKWTWRLTVRNCIVRLSYNKLSWFSVVQKFQTAFSCSLYRSWTYAAKSLGRLIKHFDVCLVPSENAANIYSRNAIITGKPVLPVS